MIFATVGSMFPFDRLVQIFDEWALAHPHEKTLIQIGDGKYLPKHTPWVRRLDSALFDAEVAKASLIVAHSGIGTIFMAFERSKPIVIVPRYAAFKEHTTDHQLHTAEWLRGKSGLVVCGKDDDLDSKIEQARLMSPSSETFSKTAPQAFIDKLRAAVHVWRALPEIRTLVKSLRDSKGASSRLARPAAEREVTLGFSIT